MRWFWRLLLGVGATHGVAQAQAVRTGAESVAAEQQLEVERPAPEPHSPWAAKPFAIDLHLGIATPLGGVGISTEYAVIPALSLSAGVGASGSGWQAAGMLRARFTPYRPRSLFVGAGYSQGRHEQSPANRYGAFSFVSVLSAMGHDAPARGHVWEPARWLNLEFGGEKRAASGVDLRGTGGVTILLNPGDAAVVGPVGPDDRIDDIGHWMVYGGLAVGLAP